MGVLYKSLEYEWLPLLWMSLVTSVCNFRHYNCTWHVSCSCLQCQSVKFETTLSCKVVYSYFSFLISVCQKVAW